MSKVENITPERAKKLIDDGAVLIDVRESHEYARENIPGARHYALSQVNRSRPAQEGDTVLIYHCKSGARTNMNAGKARRGVRRLRDLPARRRYRSLEARRPADLTAARGRRRQQQ